MRQVAIKGDDYFIWESTINDPQYKTPPPPEPLIPSDPQRYSKEPFYDPLYNISKRDSPLDGSEFVFCNRKPVIFVGYVFSKLKRDNYRREWPIDEDTGHISGPYRDSKTSTDDLDVKTQDGSDFVFIDGIPVSCFDSEVFASGDKKAVINGRVQKTGSVSGFGEFIKCNSHVYVDS